MPITSTTNALATFTNITELTNIITNNINITNFIPINQTAISSMPIDVWSILGAVATFASAVFMAWSVNEMRKQYAQNKKSKQQEQMFHLIYIILFDMLNQISKYREQLILSRNNKLSLEDENFLYIRILLTIGKLVTVINAILMRHDKKDVNYPICEEIFSKIKNIDRSIIALVRSKSKENTEIEKLRRFLTDVQFNSDYFIKFCTDPTISKSIFLEALQMYENN